MDLPKIDPEIIGKMNDLGTYGPAPIYDTINQMNEFNERKRLREQERDNAILNTAEHTARTAEAVEDIELRVAILKDDLEKERDAREFSDKRSGNIAVAALIAGILGTLIAAVALWASLTGFSLSESPQNIAQSETSGEGTQTERNNGN